MCERCAMPPLSLDLGHQSGKFFSFSFDMSHTGMSEEAGGAPCVVCLRFSTAMSSCVPSRLGRPGCGHALTISVQTRQNRSTCLANTPLVHPTAQLCSQLLSAGVSHCQQMQQIFWIQNIARTYHLSALDEDCCRHC